MDYLILLISSSLPLGLFVFVGSYFGIWRKNTTKLPILEAIVIFFGCWLLTAILLLLFKIILIGQDAETRQVFGTLWGPLIVGILIGRRVTDWRRALHKKQAALKAQLPEGASEA